MNQRHYLLKGTFLLTLTGLLTRMAGFFYKIFLSRTIGAEEIGLFQMTVPVCSFCIALACGGIQTAITRFTAEHFAGRRPERARASLLCGLLLSGSITLLCVLILYSNAAFFASRLLLEARCTALLRILCLSLPFCVIHSCINGYFMGRKQLFPSALAQILEQAARIFSVLCCTVILYSFQSKPDSSVMALGQLAGELTAALYCLLYLYFQEKNWLPLPFSNIRLAASELLSVSVPLGLNRILLCILQWIEAALLPQQLQRTGLPASEALSSYGTLTGMALPVILFPTALTGAFSSLLLPAISEARTLQKNKQLQAILSAAVRGGLLLGCFCMFSFLLFGIPTGKLLFHSDLAGEYIRHLSILCPFLYLNTTLSSVLHGFGKSTAVFLINTASFILRLASVLFLVPSFQINGYLYGLIFSQFFHSLCFLGIIVRLRIQQKPTVS